MAVSPLVFDGESVSLIYQFKNDGAYLKDYFADLICEKLVGFPKIDGIVYVPMTKKALYNRGYNQSLLLAKCVSERTFTPIIEDAIIKTEETAAQKTLTREERLENLKTCFAVNKREEIKGKSLLIVDDVLTTGATTEILCKLLLRAGAKEVYLATVASVEYSPTKKK